MNDDPDKTGSTQYRTVFDSPDSKTEFSGLLYFAPRSMAMYLVNTGKGLSLEARKNTGTRSYEIDVKTEHARIRLSVRKEIYRDDSWFPAFRE
jgi:hypothetical protein